MSDKQALDLVAAAKALWCLQNGITPHLTDHGTYYPVRYDGRYPVRAIGIEVETQFWMTAGDALAAAYDILHGEEKPGYVVLTFEDALAAAAVMYAVLENMKPGATSPESHRTKYAETEAAFGRLNTILGEVTTQ